MALSMDLGHWVNDGLMALFFFVIGLEVRREFSVGELTDPRRAAVPLVAGIGGMVVPALLYLLLNPSGDASRGLGRGDRHRHRLPARRAGRGRAAVLHPAADLPAHPDRHRRHRRGDGDRRRLLATTCSLVPLLLAVACLAAMALISRLSVWRASPFVLVGLVLWLATVEAGLHASIAGMLGGLLVAAHEPDRGDGRGRRLRLPRLPAVAAASAWAGPRGRACDRAISVNERLQAALHPWTSYVVVPVFALANAGVDLRGGVLADALASPVTWGVVLGLVSARRRHRAVRRWRRSGSASARCRRASAPGTSSAARPCRASASPSRC